MAEAQRDAAAGSSAAPGRNILVAADSSEASPRSCCMQLLLCGAADLPCRPHAGAGPSLTAYIAAYPLQDSQYALRWTALELYRPGEPRLLAALQLTKPWIWFLLTLS